MVSSRGKPDEKVLRQLANQFLAGLCQLFLLCDGSDRISAGIAFVSLGTLLTHWAAMAFLPSFAFLAFFTLRSLGTGRTRITLRTFKTSRESERCNERS